MKRTALLTCLLYAVWHGGDVVARPDSHVRTTFQAASLEPDEAVETGKDVLRRGAARKHPWYDADADDVRMLPLGGMADESGSNVEGGESAGGGRGSGRGGGAGGGRGSGRGGGAGGGRGSGRGGGSGGGRSIPARRANLSISSGAAAFMQILVWIVIGAVIVVIVYLLIKYFINRENKKTQSNAESSDVEDEENLNELPFDVKRPSGSLLDEARAAYKAGNYNQAIIYYYSYQLLQLDRRHFIHLAKGKTNRQYLREISGRRPLRQIMEQSVNAFERVFFGSHRLDRQAFEACWSKQGQFEQLVQGAAA